MIRTLTVALFLGLAGTQLVLRPEGGATPLTPPPPTTLGYGPSQTYPLGLPPQHLSDLARAAEAIVVGRVIDDRCLWNADRSMIWTHSRIAVEESWKGDTPAEVVVREPGGFIPPSGVRLSIETRYRPGERVLVFLTRDALGQVRTLGAIQGRLEIVRRGGRDRVLLERVPPHVTAGLATATPDAPPGTLLLDTLRDLVSVASAPDGQER